MITDKELIDRLKNIYIEFDNAIHWGKDCMISSMVKSDSETGKIGKADEIKAIEARRELINLIKQLENEGRSA